MIFQYEDLTFQILGIGRFSHSSGSFLVKERPYAALSYRISGDACFEIAGKKLASPCGCITFIPAHMPYKVEYSGGDSLVFHLLDCNYATPESHTPCDVRRMEALFLQALKEWRKAHSINLAKADVYTVLAQLYTEANLPADQTVLYSTRYIEAHYTDPTLTVEALCTMCHISRSSLQRKFKHFLGLTPKEYIMKQRLKLALTLLMRREGSVKEVALASGFSDEKYFSRAFRAAFGYPPREVYHL